VLRDMIAQASVRLGHWPTGPARRGTQVAETSAST
jgi:hypothetical protein